MVKENHITRKSVSHTMCINIVAKKIGFAFAE
jgi:hypothetical protein